ncbi:MAG: hypothetical protein ABI091_22815 [Ferruginibacter sp.]
MSNELENKIIGSDLCKLAELLNRFNLCDDVSSLDTAGQHCMYSSSDNSWNYDLGKIVFKVDEVGGRIPTHSEDFSVSLSVQIAGINKSEEIKNPLSKLIFNIEIEGIHSETGSDLYASWHLDEHIFLAGDEKPKYCHPIYHFAFGGEKMEEKRDMFGGCLILPTPRFAYPPMDAALGIDFILQNYFHKDKIVEIIHESQYLEIMQSAQERLWKPYFFSIMSNWDAETYTPANNFSSKMLFPLFH